MDCDDELGWVKISLYTTTNISTNPSLLLCVPYETVSDVNSFGTDRVRYPWKLLYTPYGMWGEVLGDEIPIQVSMKYT